MPVWAKTPAPPPSQSWRHGYPFKTCGDYSGNNMRAPFFSGGAGPVAGVLKNSDSERPNTPFFWARPAMTGNLIPRMASGGAVFRSGAAVPGTTMIAQAGDGPVHCHDTGRA